MFKLLTLILSVILTVAASPAHGQELPSNTITNEQFLYMNTSWPSGYVAVENYDWIPYVLGIDEVQRYVKVYHHDDPDAHGYLIEPGQRLCFDAATGLWQIYGETGDVLQVWVNDDMEAPVYLEPEGDSSLGLIGMYAASEDGYDAGIMEWSQRDASGWPPGYFNSTVIVMPPPPQPLYTPLDRFQGTYYYDGYQYKRSVDYRHWRENMRRIERNRLRQDYRNRSRQFHIKNDPRRRPGYHANDRYNSRDQGRWVNNRPDKNNNSHGKPGDKYKPGNQSRPGDRNRPGGQYRPNDKNKPGDQSRPGSHYNNKDDDRRRPDADRIRDRDRQERERKEQERKAEEQRRKDEENRKKREDERRKQEEERRRKEADRNRERERQERDRKERERKVEQQRKQVEEQRKQNEERRKKVEEERRKKDAQQKKDKDRQLQEQRKKDEEARRKQAEDNKKREDDRRREQQRKPNRK